MWNIGPTQLLIVLIIVLVLFGGKKLPDLARSLGRSLGEFKKGKEEGENLAKEEVKSLMDEVKNADVPKVEAAPQQIAAGKRKQNAAEPRNRKKSPRHGKPPPAKPFRSRPGRSRENMFSSLKNRPA